MTKVDAISVAECYNVSSRRLLFLDYDGTLTPFKDDPAQARLGAQELETLNRMGADPRNELVLISGRTVEELDNFFGSPPFLLVAEHGGFYKTPRGRWKQTFAINADWVDNVSKSVSALTFQHEGSIMERKHFSVTWHYRGITSALTDAEHNQILEAIRSLPEHGRFIIDDCQYTLELRTPSIEKGAFVSWWCRDRYDFKMAIGDSATDEDMFCALEPNGFTIRVGQSRRSHARYHLESQRDVLPFLQNLLSVNEEFRRLRQSVGLNDYLL